MHWTRALIAGLTAAGCFYGGCMFELAYLYAACHDGNWVVTELSCMLFQCGYAVSCAIVGDEQHCIPDY